MGVEGFNTSISWSGFVKRKAPPAGVTEDAETSARFRASTIDFQQKGNAVTVKDAPVKIFLDTKESWVVDGKQDPELLKHEQGHYDVTALAAREFYKKLFTLNGTDAQDLQAQIKELSESFKEKIDRTNERYDEQTDHSQRKAEQEKWNKAFAAEKQKGDGSLDNLP